MSEGQTEEPRPWQMHGCHWGTGQGASPIGPGPGSLSWGRVLPAGVVRAGVSSRVVVGDEVALTPSQAPVLCHWGQRQGPAPFVQTNGLHLASTSYGPGSS